MNGKLNSILIKTIDTISCGRSLFSQIFSAPTEIRAPTLFTRPSLYSLGSNQEGFEESNPQGQQAPACQQNVEQELSPSQPPTLATSLQVINVAKPPCHQSKHPRHQRSKASSSSKNHLQSLQCISQIKHLQSLQRQQHQDKVLQR